MLEFLNYFLLFLLLAIIIVSFYYSPRTSFGYRPAISVYTLTLTLFLLYLFFSAFLILVLNDAQFVWVPGLSEPALQFESLVTCVGSVLIFLIAYRFFWNNLRSTRRTKLTKIEGYNPFIAQFFFFAGGALKLYVVVRMGGLESVIVQLSQGVSKSLHIALVDNLTIYLQYASKTNDVAATWILVEAMRTRRTRALTIGLLEFIIATVSTYLILAKRLEVLVPLLTVALAANFYWKPISTKSLPFILGMVVFFGGGTILIRTLIPLMITGTNLNLYEVSWAHGSIFAFYFFSLEYSTYEMVTVSMVRSADILQRFGGYWSALYTTNLEPFFYVVPRALWPGKPLVFLDISHGIGSEVFSSNLDTTVGGVASTLIGVAWIFGGAPGVIAAMSFFGYLSARIDGFWKIKSKPNPSEILIYAVFCMIAFQIFRQGTLGWIFLTCFESILPFVVAAWIMGVLMMFYGRQKQARGVKQAKYPNVRWYKGRV